MTLGQNKILELQRLPDSVPGHIMALLLHKLLHVGFILSTQGHLVGDADDQVQEELGFVPVALRGTFLSRHIWVWFLGSISGRNKEKLFMEELFSRESGLKVLGLHRAGFWKTAEA